MEPSNNTNSEHETSIKSVMILYGAALFSGLVLSIFTHHIEDIGGFLVFLVTSAVLYFLVLMLYFKEGAFKKTAFGIVGLAALISIFMIFYLQMSSGSH